MTINFINELEVAKSLAFRIGEIQLKYFRKNIQVIRKSKKEFVSNVDIECQNLIIEVLNKKFTYPIISEEQRIKQEFKSDYFWIVDPIDGTHNFISGIPHFGISIGLVNKGKFILGVIFLPYYNEMFHAVMGGGAFKNNQVIHVSNNKDLEKSLVTYDNQFYLNNKSFKRYQLLIENTFTTRILGSAIYDFSLIASGNIDARVWNCTKMFDFAAGAVIVEEAGGIEH